MKANTLQSVIAQSWDVALSMLVVVVSVILKTQQFVNMLVEVPGLCGT